MTAFSFHHQIINVILSGTGLLFSGIIFHTGTKEPKEVKPKTVRSIGSVSVLPKVLEPKDLVRALRSTSSPHLVAYFLVSYFLCSYELEPTVNPGFLEWTRSIILYLNLFFHSTESWRSIYENRIGLSRRDFYPWCQRWRRSVISNVIQESIISIAIAKSVYIRSDYHATQIQ